MKKPTKYTDWLSSRREFMARIGWTDEGMYDAEFPNEYRAMLIALKKDCTVRGIAYTLGSTAATIHKDRERLGIRAKKRGGVQRKHRLFSHANKLMTCQQVADLNGCCYATAYRRLTLGEWIA